MQEMTRKQMIYYIYLFLPTYFSTIQSFESRASKSRGDAASTAGDSTLLQLKRASGLRNSR